MADAKDEKSDAKAGGGGVGAARARQRATDAQKEARARRPKSVELPVASADGDGDGDEPQYVTVRAGDPDVEYRWAVDALQQCYRWPGWTRTIANRTPKPTVLPAVPRDHDGFLSYLPGFTGRYGCCALVAQVVHNAAAGANGAPAAAPAAAPAVGAARPVPPVAGAGAGIRLVVEVTFCPEDKASRCQSTPKMCPKHCMASAAWSRLYGVQCPPCREHGVDQLWDYVNDDDEPAGVAAAPNAAAVGAAGGGAPAANQQPQQPLPAPHVQVNPPLQQPATVDLTPLYKAMQQQMDLMSALQAQVNALAARSVPAPAPAPPAPAPAPVVPTIPLWEYVSGPNYSTGASGGTPQLPGSALLSAGTADVAGAQGRPRFWIDPLSGMEVDTQTAKLSVSRDAAVVAVYNEWVRRKESKTIFEFLRAYIDHKEYVWRERPAVNGLPAVSVADQKKEWKDLVDQLQELAKDHADVTKSHAGLRVLRKLVIIHRSDSVDIVSALSESAMADPRELTIFTRYMKGLPVAGGSGVTAAVNANARVPVAGGPGGATVVELEQQPKSSN